MYIRIAEETATHARVREDAFTGVLAILRYIRASEVCVAVTYVCYCSVPVNISPYARPDSSLS